MKAEKHELPILRWHTKVLMWLLTIWGAWSVLGIGYALITAPRVMRLDLVDYYVFFSVPVLISLSAYLLFARNRFAYIPCAILPVMYLVIAKRLFPEQINLSNHVINLHYFLQFPPLYLSCAVFFTVCAVYCFALWRNGYLA
jgi:hypothetical protein